MQSVRQRIKRRGPGCLLQRIAELGKDKPGNPGGREGEFPPTRQTVVSSNTIIRSC